MNKREQEALQNTIPREPTRHELGGDIYYTCHWIKCDEQLRRWWNFCPICGQRIDWKGEE